MVTSFVIYMFILIFPLLDNHHGKTYNFFKKQQQQKKNTLTTNPAFSLFTYKNTLLTKGVRIFAFWEAWGDRTLGRKWGRSS